MNNLMKLAFRVIEINGNLIDLQNWSGEICQKLVVLMSSAHYNTSEMCTVTLS